MFKYFMYKNLDIQKVKVKPIDKMIVSAKNMDEVASLLKLQLFLCDITSHSIYYDWRTNRFSPKFYEYIDSLPTELVTALDTKTNFRIISLYEDDFTNVDSGEYLRNHAIQKIFDGVHGSYHSVNINQFIEYTTKSFRSRIFEHVCYFFGIPKFYYTEESDIGTIEKNIIEKKVPLYTGNNIYDIEKYMEESILKYFYNNLYSLFNPLRNKKDIKLLKKMVVYFKNNYKVTYSNIDKALSLFQSTDFMNDFYKLATLLDKEEFLSLSEVDQIDLVTEKLDAMVLNDNYSKNVNIKAIKKFLEI